MIKIPVYKPLLDGNEKKYVNDCIDSNWISSRGKYIQEFEDKFAHYLGVKYATGTSNGTTALHLALKSLGIGEGDEVILPTFTYIASASAIVYTGAEPVFVDSLIDTWQMNPDDVRRKITQKTKAIMAVHLYGHPCEMRELRKIARANNLFLIEDCAEALGSKFEGRNTGTFGDIAIFSFYGNKTVTTGEGGMLVTNNSSFYKTACHLKIHGVSSKKQYWHDVIGFNYKMTNICAAIGLAQLENVEKHIKLKRSIAAKFTERLKPLPLIPQPETKNVFHTFWMYSVLTENATERNGLRKFLKFNGIDTRPTFYPIHTMPMFSEKQEKHPVAENLSVRGINLPSYPSLKDKEIEFICKIIENYFGK